MRTNSHLIHCAKPDLEPTAETSTMLISCSDEELEDNRALLYLPIAPEVEDPEENPFGPPPDASGQAANADDTLAGGDKKQRQPSSDGGPAKKKARTTTIELQGVPSDGEQMQSQSLGGDVKITLPEMDTLQLLGSLLKI